MGRPLIRPTKAELQGLLTQHSYAEVAVMFSVNPATVGKWAKQYRITRTKRGDAHHNAVLEEADIPAIRALKGLITGVEVARKYEVSPGTIYDIWEYRTWWWLNSIH